MIVSFVCAKRRRSHFVLDCRRAPLEFFDISTLCEKPHKHARSSSLDLNKLKQSGPNAVPTAAVAARQPPEVPPRVSPQIVTQVSLDVEPTAFADFAHFPDGGQQATQPSAKRANAPKSLQTSLHSSAFEVYRKPASAAATFANNSIESPSDLTVDSTTIATGQPVRISAAAAAIAAASVSDYERRVAAINDSLRHVSFKQSERNVADVVHHLREQNHLLMQLCSDLTEELATVHRKKEELRARFEGVSGASNATNSVTASGRSSNSMQQHHSIV